MSSVEDSKARSYEAQISAMKVGERIIVEASSSSVRLHCSYAEDRVYDVRAAHITRRTLPGASDPLFTKAACYVSFVSSQREEDKAEKS